MDIPSFSDVWDYIVEGFSNFFSFEWIGDIGEFFSGLFENLGEFSPAGTIYGIIMVVLVYIFRKSVFAFVKTMSPATQLIMYPFFFIFAFILGYIMGKRIWES